MMKQQPEELLKEQNAQHGENDVLMLRSVIQQSHSVNDKQTI